MNSKSRLFGLALCLVAPLAFAKASPPSMPSLSERCRAEVEKLCPGDSASPVVQGCLQSKPDALTGACKSEMERLRQVGRQMSRRGGGSFSSGGGLNPLTPAVPHVVYEGRGLWKSPSFREQKFGAVMPVWTGEIDRVAMSLGGSHIRLGEEVRLDSGTLLPRDLYRLELGSQYSRMTVERKSYSLRGSFGGTGDKLEKGTSFSLIGSYGWPGSGKGYWLTVLYFSNNGPFGNYVPIPGVIYVHRTDTLMLMVGLPTMGLQWTPTPDWSLSASLFGPSVSTEAAYGDFDKLQVFTGFQWNRQNFVLSERVEDRDRLTIEEKRASGGFRFPIVSNLRAELQAGYGFDRSAYVGDGFLDKSRGQAELPDDWFASLALRLAL